MAPRTSASLLVVLLPLVLGAGCRVVEAAAKAVRPKKDEGLVERQLEAKLAEFADNFSISIQRCSDRIVAESDDNEVRRRAVEWKVRTIPLVRRIVREENAQEALPDLWALSFQLRHYVEDAEGRETFPEHAESLAAALAEIQQGIEEIAAEILSEKDFLAAKEEVEAFARAHPISGSFSRQQQLPSRASEKRRFNWTSGIPVLGAFDGLDEGARAVREVAIAAERFTQVAAHIPEEMRWQSELLLYDIEDRETLATLREGVAAIAAGSSELTETARALPEDVRSIVDSSFDRLEEQRAGLDATVEGARLAVQDLDVAIASGADLSASLERTADSLARASLALESMAKTFMGEETDAAEGVPVEPVDSARAPSTPDDGEESEGGFDPVEYGVAADSIGAAATELRVLVSEVREMVGSGEIDGVLTGAEGRAEDLVDRIALRVVQILGALLVVLLLYRFLAPRLGARA